jgi:K+-sensing histidine kinase KdpD
MNLVGNSLKYTHSGFVAIQLRQHLPVLPNDSENQNKASQDTATVEIIVTDTGRGISKEFLETKLFTPFSQESTLAPGTGTYALLTLILSNAYVARPRIEYSSLTRTTSKRKNRRHK